MPGNKTFIELSDSEYILLKRLAENTLTQIEKNEPEFPRFMSVSDLLDLRSIVSEITNAKRRFITVKGKSKKNRKALNKFEPASLTGNSHDKVFSKGT